MLGPESQEMEVLRKFSRLRTKQRISAMIRNLSPGQ